MRYFEIVKKPNKFQKFNSEFLSSSIEDQFLSCLGKYSSFFIFLFVLFFYFFSCFPCFPFFDFSPSGPAKISETRDITIYHSKTRDNLKIEFRILFSIFKIVKKNSKSPRHEWEGREKGKNKGKKRKSGKTKKENKGGKKKKQKREVKGGEEVKKRKKATRHIGTPCAYDVTVSLVGHPHHISVQVRVLASHFPVQRVDEEGRVVPESCGTSRCLSTYHSLPETVVDGDGGGPGSTLRSR